MDQLGLISLAYGLDITPLICLLHCIGHRGFLSHYLLLFLYFF